MASNPQGFDPPEPEPGVKGPPRRGGLSLGLIMLLLLALILAFLFGYARNKNYKLLVPGPVAEQSRTPLTLAASFTVSDDLSAPVLSLLAARSYGSGGACLIGDLAKLDRKLEQSCTDHSACNRHWNKFVTDNATNAKFDSAAWGASNGYCVARRCWYRPGRAACMMQPAPGKWADGPHDLGPYELPHVDKLLGANADAEWQVITCANRATWRQHDGADCPKSEGIYTPGSF